MTVPLAKVCKQQQQGMKDWQRRRRRRRRPCAHLKPCEEEVRADSANMLLLFYWKSFFSPPRTAGPHSHPHPRHAYTSPHSSFLLASTHHSLTHSASGRFELRAASNSTLQYALGRMEMWKVGNWLKIRELLRLGLTACQLAWLLFSILKAELGQMLFALSLVAEANAAV